MSEATDSDGMADEETGGYSARVLETIAGGWGSVRVGVFRGSEQVGEYRRNYRGTPPFAPFEQGGRWYALYSRNYTATRLMSLPDCADLGGEEPAGGGFCPVEYHVPLLTGRDRDPADPEPVLPNWEAAKWARKVEKRTPDGMTYTRLYWPWDPEGFTHLKDEYEQTLARQTALHNQWSDRRPFVSRHAPWGLVSGCVWGDDSGGWKVQHLDLSRAADGVLVRDDRFGKDMPWGQLALPRGVSLKDAVDTEGIGEHGGDPAEVRFSIAVPAWFDLTGRRHEEGDGS